MVGVRMCSGGRPTKSGWLLLDVAGGGDGGDEVRLAMVVVGLMLGVANKPDDIPSNTETRGRPTDKQHRQR